MEEWKEYRLGDICTKIGSGATPKGGKEAYLWLKERFREAEVQSSRLHAIKRSITHSVRQMAKRELRKEVD